MSYCLGMRLDEGLVFLSDSRTNAGVDSVATFRKTFLFDGAEDRVLVLLSAGNLAITQSVISLLTERLAETDRERSLYAAPSLFEAARLIGRVLREVHDQDGNALAAQGVEFAASFILGGQIKGEAPRLFHIYSAGNFIEASRETPYFQIGETKYGKPILERVLRPEMPLLDAAKCGLVSFDSTIRANLSVGLPLDLTICFTDAFTVSMRRSFETTDPYFTRLGQVWGNGLRTLFLTLPNPDWAATLETAQEAHAGSIPSIGHTG
ncbi:MAG: proteasome-type protease [Rhodospirillaceae bacterium]|nr:proteasome-type protease [Rhodospirillaceae bacterium]